MDLKFVLGAYLDADFEWFGAWGLLFGGWWRDLGDPELPGGPEIKSMRGPGGFPLLYGFAGEGLCAP